MAPGPGAIGTDQADEQQIAVGNRIKRSGHLYWTPWVARGVIPAEVGGHSFIEIVRIGIKIVAIGAVAMCRQSVRSSRALPAKKAYVSLAGERAMLQGDEEDDHVVAFNISTHCVAWCRSRLSLSVWSEGNT